MDKVWFQHCISGLLSLSGIQQNDLRDVCERYPYQANMRYILGLKATSTQHKNKSGLNPEALDVPDRKALFLQLGLGPILPNLELDKGLETQKTMIGTASTEKPNLRAERLLLLPKYVKPETAIEEIEEYEDELAGLEDRLLAHFSEDYIKEQQNAMDMSEREKSSPPPKMPLLDKINKSLNQSAFGQNVSAQSPIKTGFIQWLEQFKFTATSATILQDSPEIPASLVDVTPKDETIIGDTHTEKKDSTGSKKKKKKRKEAKLLAKASVKKSNEIATETLAALLARQGHHEQALAMYERLILLFPEKKSTFAAQIAKIKRKQI
ncbi:MAG: hypothetical protein KA479_01845 [Saprospiraceae bacterium]|nr:hypothetical protein [Saprospiraceae bacterium]